MFSCCSLVSSTDLITCKHFVSSANTKGVKHSGRSLMKMTKSSSPRTLPWGTPERTFHCSDCESPIFTH